MKRILITGATGNIGVEIVKFLFLKKTDIKIVVGVRNVEKTKYLFKNYPTLEYTSFDFENPETFTASLRNIDTVFLLRPPHISDVDKYIKPLLEAIKMNGITQIVFLSVQGAERSKIIPHNKIERLIYDLNFNYIFLRPSYFMQNLTTTLLDDIRAKRMIILPAGKAKFNWIDISNIGEVAAELLIRFDEYKDQAIEITGNENLSFDHAAKTISEVTGKTIRYISPNPLRYYFIKRNEGVPKGLVLVMIMLHFIPRFQNEPKISSFYLLLTNKNPTSLKDFIIREREIFIRN
jgi:uncharacterized protein YbjT (DUF2867 family)